MQSPLAGSGKPSACVRLAFVGALTLLLSGWTCTAIFVSCPGVTQPQIASLSPESIPHDADSTVLIVSGSGFALQSQILWNGNALPTTLIDSNHAQTIITQQTFQTFGGSSGSNVRISVQSQGIAVGTGCPIDGTSAALILIIN